MDPNSTLSEVLLLASSVRDEVNRLSDRGKLPADGPLVDLVSEAEQLASAVDDLDGWLARGGFLPSRWADVRRNSNA